VALVRIAEARDLRAVAVSVAAHGRGASAPTMTVNPQVDNTNLLKLSISVVGHGYLASLLHRYPAGIGVLTGTGLAASSGW